MITGKRFSFDKVVVEHNGKPIDLYRSLQVYAHSPTGFNWGYLGSGPAQLALAILLEFAPEDVAIRLHQSFKVEFLSGLKEDNWGIDDIIIQNWIKQKQSGCKWCDDE